MGERVVIIGGGASGIFAAVACAEANPDVEVIVLEKSLRILDKVRVSGGGRCNVTHACFDPRELTTYYPRGSVELLGPFNKFGPSDLMDWFASRGVDLKIEEDNRVFPVSDNSQTIIDCMIEFADRAGVKIFTKKSVNFISKENEKWVIRCDDKSDYRADKIMIASGGNKKMWDLLKKIGHHIIPPVPSLFTFNIRDSRIKGLSGISIPYVDVEIANSDLQSDGPLLITHWGLSGPAILKLSSIGAFELHDRSYHFPVMINWLGGKSTEEVYEIVNEERHIGPKKRVYTNTLFNLPLRLWKSLMIDAKIPEKSTWADLSAQKVKDISEALTMSIFQVSGKSTFKEEFVTAGGVKLEEVNFKSFESKIEKGLFIAGEALNIDAVTGGFNFQAAWTGGWLAGNAMAGFED